MGFIAPREVYENPKRWLDVPHELHQSLGGLMDILFTDFRDKLKKAEVHCLMCEGHPNYEMGVMGVPGVQVCNGYVGSPDDADKVLLHYISKEKYIENMEAKKSNENDNRGSQGSGSN